MYLREWPLWVPFVEEDVKKLKVGWPPEGGEKYLPGISRATLNPQTHRA